MGDMTDKQAKYIKALVKHGHKIPLGSMLDESLAEVLGGKAGVASALASQIITQLLLSDKPMKITKLDPDLWTFDKPEVTFGEPSPFTPSKEQLAFMKDPLADVPKLDEFSEYKDMMAKPRGFWAAPSSLEIVKAVAEGAMTATKGAELLDVGVHKMKARASLYKKHGESMGFGGVRTPKKADENTLVTIPYAQMSKNHIDWARFLELKSPERFDLRRISAMCYASEKIINYKPRRGLQVPQEFRVVQAKAQSFVEQWAIYFGKYALAACLGEFRHRRTSGPVKLVPMGRGSVARTAAQSAAENLWPNKENAIKAAAWMADKFKDHAYFTGGGYGGGPWSRIADTLLKWLNGDIPDIVWVDYVWDLSHNGGCFFDKCQLWEKEEENRGLLTLKRNSKSGDVREWGEQYLHAEWKDALDAIEIMDMPAPERG